MADQLPHDSNRHSIAESEDLDVGLQSWPLNSVSIQRRSTAPYCLEVSRSAHRVTRAAAPFTAFLVGMSAGQQGGSAEAMIRAATTALRLISSYTQEA
jgi:hypothetical protein